MVVLTHLFVTLPSVMTRKILTIALLLLLGASSCGRQRIPSGAVVNTDSIFNDLTGIQVAERALIADSIFTTLNLNGVVLYAEQGRIVYEKAFGYRDLSLRKRDSLRIDDAFQLSSDSKMFTAMAIMLLQAEGKLDYDDDVRKFIPELPYTGITLRMLLNHRSGLPRYDAMADTYWPNRRKPFSNEAMIDMMAERKPQPYGVPDATYFYNNINYALLASVVERATREHFEDFLRERIFEPLGMNHSFVYSMRNDASVSLYMPTDVQGHDIYKKGPVKTQNDYLNGVMGDKIMFSTVEDLWTFNEALDLHLLLPDSLQAIAFQPGSPVWKNGENYGFGWRMTEEHPGAYFHYGWWKGYRSAVIRDTAHRRYLAILCNTTQQIPPEVIWDFISDTTACLPESSMYLGE